MVSNWLKTAILVLLVVDLWLSYEIWNLLGGGFWGVVLLGFGFFNLTLGMSFGYLALFQALRKEMEEEDEIEVHTFRYSVEKEPTDSRVLTLIDSSEMELKPDLPPVS